MQMPRRSSAVALFSLILLGIIGFISPSNVAIADDAKPAEKSDERKQPWKSEDFIYSDFVGQYKVSPDGKWLAWTKSAGDKDKDGRIANLYLSSLTGEPHELALTRGNDNNAQPKWSPDGEKIAFFSTRTRPKAKPDTSPMQLWLINAHGGEAWHLTDLAHSPKQAEWLDKDTIVFSAPEDPALY
jgi:dipeptidyl aminopeptidase/acylaminoacyl peptidase